MNRITSKNTNFIVMPRAQGMTFYKICLSVIMTRIDGKKRTFLIKNKKEIENGKYTY